MKLIINLILQFFHIGLFSFGGGYATLPFLYELSDKFRWFSTNELTNIIAISSITPGPIGINMATYTGFVTLGILGALLATTAIIIPSFIIASATYKAIDKFKKNSYVNSVIKSLKACGCALLTAVGIKLLFTSNLHLLGIITLVILISTSFIKKLDPIFYLGITGIIGFVFGYLHLIGV